MMVLEEKERDTINMTNDEKELIIQNNSKAIHYAINTILSKYNFGKDVNNMYHEDIYQDCCIKLYNKLDKYNGDKGTIASYIYYTCYGFISSTFGSYNKKSNREMYNVYLDDNVNEYNNSSLMDSLIVSSDENIIHNYNIIEITDYIRSLDHPHMDMFIKKYYYGYKDCELAEEFNLSKQVVYNRLHICMGKVIASLMIKYPDIVTEQFIDHIFNDFHKDTSNAMMHYLYKTDNFYKFLDKFCENGTALINKFIKKRRKYDKSNN